MRKITVTVSDDLEKRLREYVTGRYPERPYGKLSRVVEEAIERFLKRKALIGSVVTRSE